MKVSTLFFIILFTLTTNVSANNLKFGWNIGNIQLSYDVINNSPIFDADILHFNWLYNTFSIGFNVLEYYNIDNGELFDFSILPISIAFVPLNFRDTFFFSVYTNGGLRLTPFNTEFYGAIGTNFFIFPKLMLHYAPFFSLFAEYSTRNELRFGFGMDLSFIFFIALMAIKEETDRKIVN